MANVVRVGDIVTWRKAGHKHAIGVARCEVLELGQDEHGKPAALILALGQMVGALVEDLHHDE